MDVITALDLKLLYDDIDYLRDSNRGQGLSDEEVNAITPKDHECIRQRISGILEVTASNQHLYRETIRPWTHDDVTLSLKKSNVVAFTETTGPAISTWYSQEATIPFDIIFTMPPLDKRTRGYTPQYIEELQRTFGRQW